MSTYTSLLLYTIYILILRLRDIVSGLTSWNIIQTLLIVSTKKKQKQIEADIPLGATPQPSRNTDAINNESIRAPHWEVNEPSGNAVSRIMIIVLERRGERQYINVNGWQKR